MKKYIKKLVLFGMITMPICGVFAICVVTGVIVVSYNGFAVDNDGMLYVGKNRKIDVYDNSEFVKTVYCTTRGYHFTIQDENLYIATGGQVKIMDLYGRIIETIEDSTYGEEHRLAKERFLYVTDDARYVATNTFGFYKITKCSNDGGSEVVYQKPILDFVLGLAGPLSFAAFMIFLFVVRLKSIAEEPPINNWKDFFWRTKR